MINPHERYNRRQLIRKIRKMDRSYPYLEGLVYRSLYGFLVDHGRFYNVRHFDLHTFGQDAPKQCFANAMRLAAKTGMRYVEGLAVTRKDCMAVQHGWCVDDAGDVIDSTWLNRGLLYLGVEFSIERADDAIWNGDASILNDENRGYPIFQKRWVGEDYGLVWPDSDRIEAYKSGDPAALLRVRSVIEELAKCE
jgi:hypothetical protein